MTRVLLVGDYPPPYGGVSVQVAALQARLAALPGTCVAVLDIGSRRRERRPGCLPVRGARPFAAALCAHAARGFTLHLHTNGHNPKSWLVSAACAAAGLANGRRTVVSLGSGSMPGYVGRLRGPMRALVRATVALTGAFIVRNEPSAAALHALGAPPDKVTVLPGFYGVAPEELGRLPDALTRFWSCHRPLVGVVASVGPEYGLDLLIDATARLRPRHPDLGVVLIGPDRMEHGRPRWALALGELPRPAMLATMNALDVFVRPTYFDGDASSVREALALGVRVVASDTDYRPEGARVFPRGDADALAGAIADALAAPAVRVESTALPALLRLYDALEQRRRRPEPAAVPASMARGGRRVA
jgi:glycosyltransferase involved in cell wall biosynthesis